MSASRETVAAAVERLRRKRTAAGAEKPRDPVTLSGPLPVARPVDGLKARMPSEATPLLPPVLSVPPVLQEAPPVKKDREVVDSLLIGRPRGG